MTDAPDIHLSATDFTIHASEKVSTGEYETAQYDTTIKGEISHGSVDLDEATRKELKAKLLAIHKDAQETVERAAENRIARDEAEDWGVHNGGEDD
jgi:hypothetical protein